ncbi:SARP family transcriptional regulator [Streptomyces nigrescens]|uniref:SARP family transcriptional regulator n=1 Tax=Streptomyces nigrescens TaxID=1920 RepID=A0ABN6R2A5_STRNI|nr:BTAD domain-containing putative transcriptional regulator [Streptomyces nigrescens]BDM71526.1 SARP family transcriptional regulator [Streptomyces nigrescens]
MQFRVLATLDVRSADGRPAPVPEKKVRALLAALLAHHGRPVSADRLIEHLWGPRPPAHPTASLQSKVSQLRRALDTAEPGARKLVATAPPGYRLDITADALDAGRFTALTTRARTARSAADRAGLLTEALDLWQGPAFAGFADDDLVRPVAEALEEQRLTALEEHAAARLELGEHAALTGELAALVARHPLRERLRALQLTALYRSGRQSEALAAYGEIRTRLAEELGVDPGAELTAVHQAILRQEPWQPRPAAITAPAHTPGAQPDPHPRPRTNLPTPLTELLGREDAVRQVGQTLADHRLVTLTGPGGVGKTRLALETAGRLAGDFPDGIWLVELAALGRPDDPDHGRRAKCTAAEVAEAVLAVLGVQEGAAAGPVAERLVAAVRGKRLLLVLDNCEHLVDAAAEVTAELLAAAPRLRVLVTGQEPLGLAGERIRPVPPLAPDGAIALFAARAGAADPGFVLDAGSAPAVAEICRRLDGIPLALELAATRVRVLGVRELSARLDDRFRLPAAARRGAPPRQQTLRAMIDWSWELLPGPERTVLRRLAVHADGCTLEAAEWVCAGDGIAREHVLELLARLVDRSLVAVARTPYGTRYRLLETVAAYCLERLREAGELSAVRRRHQLHYTELAEQAAPLLYGAAQREWLERLDQETANLRGALDGAVADGAADRALRLVNALAWYWFLRGRLAEAGRSLDAALTASEGDHPDVPEGRRLRAAAWQVGMASLAGGDADPVTRAAAVLRRYEAHDDPGERAWAQWFLGYAQVGLGDPDLAADRMVRALTAFRALGDRWGTAAALSSRAQGTGGEDLPARRRAAEESVALFAELGDRWGQLQAGDALAAIAEITGDYGRAARLHQEGLRSAEELGLRIQVSYKLSGLGRIALLTGDLAAAREHHERALRLAAEQSHRRGEMFAECGLALGARREGRLDEAEAHLLPWLEWCRGREGDPGTAFVLAELGFLAELRGDAATAHRHHLDGFAAARATGDPRAVAMALEGLAGARTLAGHLASAARLLGAADALRAAAGAPQPAAERADVTRSTTAARAGLGARAFDAAYAHGAERTPEELVAEDLYGVPVIPPSTRSSIPLT